MSESHELWREVNKYQNHQKITDEYHRGERRREPWRRVRNAGREQHLKLAFIIKQNIIKNAEASRIPLSISSRRNVITVFLFETEVAITSYMLKIGVVPAKWEDMGGASCIIGEAEKKPEY